MTDSQAPSCLTSRGSQPRLGTSGRGVSVREQRLAAPAGWLRQEARGAHPCGRRRRAASPEPQRIAPSIGFFLGGSHGSSLGAKEGSGRGRQGQLLTDATPAAETRMPAGGGGWPAAGPEPAGLRNNNRHSSSSPAPGCALCAVAHSALSADAEGGLAAVTAIPVLQTGN